MKNIDRALAYAKQRGVAIPETIGWIEDLSTDEMKSRLLEHHGIKVLSKTRRPELVDRLTLETLKPFLTPAQRRRIRRSDDSSRALRDRKGRKLQRKQKRLAWLRGER